MRLPTQTLRFEPVSNLNFVFFFLFFGEVSLSGIPVFPYLPGYFIKGGGREFATNSFSPSAYSVLPELKLNHTSTRVRLPCCAPALHILSVQVT